VQLCDDTDEAQSILSCQVFYGVRSCENHVGRRVEQRVMWDWMLRSHRKKTHGGDVTGNQTASTFQYITLQLTFFSEPWPRDFFVLGVR
jgi:hypothetical protein